MLHQIVSVVGAALILLAYVALQTGRMAREDRAFNVMNFVGSALLTWIAVVEAQIGFIILEGSWALLSLPGTLRRRS